MIFKEIPIDKIVVNKNIRSDPDGDLGGLMDTIEKHGVLQPMLVRPKEGQYELISGHRRFEAMKARNEVHVPCIVRSDFSDNEIPFVKLIENVQRKQLSSYELVEIFEAMKKATPGLTNERIARMVGKSATWVYFKYKAAKIYMELVDQGLPDRAIDELTEAELLKLAKVKDKSEKKKIVKKARSSREFFELVESASSYIGSRKQESYRNLGLKEAGFKILLSGKYNLLVVCVDEKTQREISSVLFDHLVKKIKQHEGITS